jgi:hypothetical protein
VTQNSSRVVRRVIARSRSLISPAGVFARSAAATNSLVIAASTTICWPIAASTSRPTCSE